MKDDLKTLNFHGFLCSPKESLEEYHKRVEFFKQHSSNLLLAELPKHAFVMKLACEELDLEISWLSGYIAKKKLSLWEPAATWIYKIKGFSVPVLQLKSNTQKKNTEILQHEAIHIARSSFQEPIYEEFLAYAVSTCKWRRILGPLFRFPKEGLFLVFFSFLPLIGCLFIDAQLLLLTPFFLFLIYLFIRLGIHYRIFKKALCMIRSVFDVDAPLKVAIRLSDKEIKLFGSSSLEEVRNYINKQKCLRWEQIICSYKIKIN